MDKTIPWKDENSVGVEEVDQQHKELFKIYNHLANLPQDKYSQQEFGKAIENLASYAEYHFRFEEEFYKDDQELYNTHRRKHFDFIKKVISLSGKPKNPDVVADELLCFTSLWLVTHILNEDKEAFAAMRDRD